MPAVCLCLLSIVILGTAEIVLKTNAAALSVIRQHILNTEK
jgi:hypothetical protein